MNGHQLPDISSPEWRRSREQASNNGGAASYQAPGGVEIYFSCSSVRLSGGQSLDTMEYPFFGGWSVNSLNEKPQSFKVSGKLIHRPSATTSPLQQRNTLVNALQIITNDDAPGTLWLAFWGRFPVIVESWDVGDKTDEQGVVSLEFTFMRAGSSTTKVTTEPFAAIMDRYVNACVYMWIIDLPDDALSVDALLAAFNAIKAGLLTIVGYTQSVRDFVDKITAQISGLINMVEQGISDAENLGRAFFGVFAALATGIVDLFNSESNETIDAQTLKAITFHLISNPSLISEFVPSTPRESLINNATKQLWQAGVYLASGVLLSNCPLDSSGSARSLLALYVKVEACLERNEVEVYEACAQLRLYVSTMLSEAHYAPEKSIYINKPIALLVLAYELKVPLEKLRVLNPLLGRNEFAVKGHIRYV